MPDNKPDSPPETPPSELPDHSPDNTPGLLRASALVGSMTMLSRILGLVRYVSDFGPQILAWTSARKSAGRSEYPGNVLCSSNGRSILQAARFNSMIGSCRRPS